MTIGSRLKELRTSLGLKQEEFAVYFNVPGHKIGDIEQDRHKLPLDFLPTLEENFSVNIRWLLIGKGEMIINISEFKENHSISDIQKTLQISFEIPILCAIIEKDKEILSNAEGRVLIIPKDLIKTLNLINSRFFAFQVESNSMSPEFNKNDVVIVDEQQKDIVIDEPYLIQYDNKYLLTRAKLTSGQTSFMTDKFKDIYKGNESNVVGKIVAFLRAV